MVADGLTGIDGRRIDPAVLDGNAVLVVNVASKCGLTPQYEGLERLQERYRAAGFTVLGVPCNQFAGQEPGTPEEIQQFCSTTYGASFPLTEKLEVNGRHRHPLYERLTAVPDADGRAGEVEWNFEKFLISPAGEIVARFRPRVEPEDDQVTRDRARASLTLAPATVKATEVQLGDRLRARSGAELTVTRIDEEFMGRANMLAFVEDSEEQWFKMPALRDGDVELVRRDDAVD